jgi:hypothetical protein
MNNTQHNNIQHLVSQCCVSGLNVVNLSVVVSYERERDEKKGCQNTRDKKGKEKGTTMKEERMKEKCEEMS